MKSMMKLGISAAALSAMLVLSAGAASAADPADAGCSLHGAVMMGGMFGNQSYDASLRRSRLR